MLGTKDYLFNDVDVAERFGRELRHQLERLIYPNGRSDVSYDNKTTIISESCISPNTIIKRDSE